jgi:signal transduction histidine kinase
LGLAIVRTFVVSDLGGTITIGAAHTEEPQGALVEIRVPRRRSDPVVVG